MISMYAYVNPPVCSCYFFSPLANNVIKMKVLIINVHRLDFNLFNLYLFIFCYVCNEEHGVWTFNALKSLKGTCTLKIKQTNKKDQFVFHC